MRWAGAHTLAATILLGGGISGPDLLGAPRVTLADGRLAQGNTRFVVRGVAYSNAAVGEPAGYRLAASTCRWARDLPLLAAAGANTVRTYGLLPEGANAFLDLLESTGLYWLAGFPLEPYYDPARTILASKRQILDAFGEYARRFRSQRRLIGYVFGNEVTRDYQAKFAGAVEDFYALLGEAAETLRQIEPEETPLLTTAVHEAGELARSPAGLSFWCWNANPGRSFGGRLEEVRRLAAKPVLISEFGVDAFDERTRQEDEQAQAEAAGTLVKEIAGASWLLGGVYSSLLDEWWRGSPDAGRHGAGGSPHAGFPDGFRNEGWQGLFRVAATEQPGLDILYRRAAYGVLAARWGGWGLAAAEAPRLLRVENAASGTELIAPGALARVSGERLTHAVTAEASWPLHLGQTCVCFADAAARMGMSAPGEISAQVPPVLAPGETKAVAYRAGVKGNALPVTLRRYAPGIFPRGVVWAGSACATSPQNGARPGDWLEVYATGLGSGADVEPVRAELAGQPAPLLYWGPLAAAVGIHQVNLQVPPDMERTLGSGLRLVEGGISSNLYPLSVAGAGDRPGIALRADPPELVLQAGGAPRAVTVQVEGVNGFCGAVLFQAARAPEGIWFQIPAAFPGQTVPLAVSAAPGTPALADSMLVLTGYSGGASGQMALKLMVLPNQGDIPVRVVSGGFTAGPLARFDWNWRTLFWTSGGGPGRGLNVMSVNPATGVFSAVRTFDTWGDQQAAAGLVQYLGALASGSIVLMAVADEASYRLSGQARDAIAGWFGSQYVRSLGYQHSWALIGRKGALKPMAEAGAPDRQVTLEKDLTLPQP